MKMETSLYDDDLGVKKLKRPMTLDFSTGPSAKKPKFGGNLLSSPDLKLLQLASPELERMIIQQNGMVTTTPTPSQFICPKSVTEEQEAYARGFVDALNELHARGPVPTAPASSSPPLTSRAKLEPDTDHEYSTTRTSLVPAYSAVTTAAAPVAAHPGTMQTNTTYSSSTLSSTGTFLTNDNVRQTHVQNGVLSAGNTTLPTMQSLLVPAGIMRLKEEPQTVPNCSSPPVHTIPIDMEEQEVIKVERKRERNRVAARKCRNRKLERISRLEERVDELKGHNSTLATTAASLRDQVCQLKQQIMEHVSSGCQVMLSQNIL